MRWKGPVGALLFVIWGVFTAIPRGVSKPRLIVYTYTSFERYGIGAFLKERFEKSCACHVEYVPCSTGMGLLNRLILEGARTLADVVVGLYGLLLKRAKATGLFQPLSEFHDLLIPYSYNYLTFVYGTRQTPPPALKVLPFSRSPPWAN